jgi:hypothetical protein
MNWAHIHLAFNHLPVILVPVAGIMLALAAFKKSAELMRASLGMLVAAAAIGIAVYFTGEPAEHAVEALPGISKMDIEAHEEAAEAAVIATALAGLVALGLLAKARSGSISIGLVMLTLLVTFVAAALMARAANFGGAIRHPEITLTLLRRDAIFHPIGAVRPEASRGDCYGTGALNEHCGEAFGFPSV